MRIWCKIIAILLFISTTSCVYKKIHKSEFPPSHASFSVLSFLNQTLTGQTPKLFFSKKFSFAINWNSNAYVKEDLNTYLKQEGFINKPIKYDEDFFALNQEHSINDLLSDIRSNNTDLPDYYLLIIPRNKTLPNEGGNSSGGGSLTVALAILTMEIIWLLIDENSDTTGYRASNILSDPLYHEKMQYEGSGFKILSSTGFLSKRNYCGSSFDIIVIDRHNAKIIAFDQSTFQIKSRYYNLGAFDSFEDVPAWKRKEIKHKCLEELRKSVNTSLKKRINLKAINTTQ